MEGSTYLSGNAIVDEISQLRINSIPDCWYHNIKKNGQTQAMAILVLWDLLYWYKWTELRDEHTGLITGYKKKFAADLLQRSYSDIGAKFGITKRQATDVISFLAELGVLKKHLRTISFKNGLRCNNVLFIELIPSKIKEISNEKTAPIYTPTGTDESYIIEDEEVSRNDVTPSHEKTSDLYTSKRETNTTNTTIISTNNSTTNLNRSEAPISAKPKSKKIDESEKQLEFLNNLDEDVRNQALELKNYLLEKHRTIDPKYNRQAKQFIEWQFYLAKCITEQDRTPEEIKTAIDFVINDDFWNPIASTPKGLHKHFQTVYEKALVKNRKNSGYQKPNYNQQNFNLERLRSRPAIELDENGCII